MNRAGSFILLIVFIFAATQAIVPASGWLWPIFGFGAPASGCPNACGGPGLPAPLNAMTPGTYQWGYPPVGRAELVAPGCAYGLSAFHGSINLGLTPPFGLTIADHASQAVATAAESLPRNNTTMVTSDNEGGSQGGLAGWLSSAR